MAFDKEELPFVSVLIPLRNEGKNIPDLLECLSKLNYPTDRYEILLANDASTDATGALLETFVSGRPNTRLFHLAEEHSSKLKGKTRVLNLLCDEARGELFLFTDADISMPAAWIHAMVRPFIENPNLGVAVGVTGMKSRPIWHALQGMEWISVLFLVHKLSRLGIEGTGMGNNMAVSKKAYLATGGYSKIPFSIVEDYALYKAITAKNFEFVQLFEPDILAYTIPPENLLKQRARWISGGIESKSNLAWFGFIQCLWIPLCIAIAFFSSQLALVFCLFPLLINFMFIYSWEKRLGIRGYLKYVPIFTIYMPIAWLVQTCYWLFSKRIEWKERKY